MPNPASLISGKKTHIIAGISLHSKGAIKDEAKKKLQEFWRDVRRLIIDEVSMISRSFLATSSRNIAIGIEGAPGVSQRRSFGGPERYLRDLCGDLHRFPPVACAKSEILYYQINLTKDSDDAKVGLRIYEEFSDQTLTWLHQATMARAVSMYCHCFVKPIRESVRREVCPCIRDW